MILNILYTVFAYHDTQCGFMHRHYILGKEYFQCIFKMLLSDYIAMNPRFG